MICAFGGTRPQPARRVPLVNGKATDVTESSNRELSIEDEATADHPTSEPSGDQIPLACPECNGPLYELKDGEQLFKRLDILDRI